MAKNGHEMALTNRQGEIKIDEGGCHHGAGRNTISR